MPNVAFVGQFYGCMREVDRACNGFFSAAKEEAAEPEPAAIGGDDDDELPALDDNDDGGFPDFGAGASNWAEDMDAHEEEDKKALEQCDNFLDIGCAPAGFSQFLLDHSRRWRGIGLTLESGGHEMDERFMASARREPDPRELGGGGVVDRFKLIYGDVTESPDTLHYSPTGEKLPVGSAPQFELVIAGARSSKSGNCKGTTTGAQVKTLLTSQLLASLLNLKPGGSLVVVLNITPQLTHLATLCFLCVVDTSMFLLPYSLTV